MAKVTNSSKAPKNGTSKKGFANPFRVGGAYHATVATLEKLGANKTHSYAAFEKAFTQWEGYKEWAGKEKRNPNGKDAAAKLYQNVTVLQRDDYGAPLHDQGACLDLTRDDKGDLQIALNLKSKSPMKPGRKPVTKAPAEPAKASAKGKAAGKAKKAAPAKKVDATKPPILSGRDAVAALKAGK